MSESASLDESIALLEPGTWLGSGPAAFGSMLGLGLLFVSMTLGWLCLYAAVRRPIRRLPSTAPDPPNVRCRDGAILIAFDVRLAAEPQ